MTEDNKIKIYLKVIELIFDKSLYESAVRGKAGDDAHIADHSRNAAFSSYAMDLTNALIMKFEDHEPSAE